MPLHERRTRLLRLIPAGEAALWFSSHVEGKAGPALFRHACGMRLEGIVSKRIGSPYRSGPFPAWRKIKCPEYVRP
jgi:bifunctional non-homologous end joining protein LigD